MAAKRRKSSDLMHALDRAQQASTNLQVRMLLHELQVHSEEITVQNEQLLKAQTELEQARDLYADLYDFAPIGYVSLNARNAIVEINFAGASILGRERRYVINVSLLTMVDAVDRGRAREFLAEARDSDGGVLPRIDVRLKQTEARVVRLMARPLATLTRPRALFTTMLDVTEEHRLNVERHDLLQREQQRAAELAAEVAVRIGAEERIKALLARVVTVQEDERARFARNLHDHLGQQLTSLRIAISTLRQTCGGETDTHFERIERLLAQLDRDLDFLAWEMRPAALDDMGLEDAMRAFLEQWSSLHGVHVEFHASTNPKTRLPSEIESHLYRILQEALNNVGKHARATRVSVTLRRQPNDVTLLVEDDGKGVDTKTLKRSSARGMGLAGIEERAALIGGTVEFESSPNKGAALFVCIPL